jgi:hypothetical protein
LNLTGMPEEPEQHQQQQQQQAQRVAMEESLIEL